MEKSMDRWVNEWVGRYKNRRKKAQRGRWINKLTQSFPWANFQVSSFLEQTETTGKENQGSVPKRLVIP